MVDIGAMGPSKALIVVTSTGLPYLRHDGVGVVPITALKPWSSSLFGSAGANPWRLGRRWRPRGSNAVVH